MWRYSPSQACAHDIPETAMGRGLRALELRRAQDCLSVTRHGAGLLFLWLPAGPLSKSGDLARFERCRVVSLPSGFVTVPAKLNGTLELGSLSGLYRLCAKAQAG